MRRKILKIIMWVLLALLLLFAVSVWRNWDTIQRVFLGGVTVHETEPPTLPSEIASPAILVFSKTNAFRHEEAIPAANAMFRKLAEENRWGYYATENGATFSPEILARFDAVVFNNVSGDVFTDDQRSAFKSFVENGGGWLGIHAAGDGSDNWPWYSESMIGAKFIGHPMDPQFQEATMKIEDRQHPATRHLRLTLERTDEWYSFDMSPRSVPGVHVLATLDEDSYVQEGPFGQDLTMGEDHPILWWRCVGSGRTMYSAGGHTADSYREPAYREILAGSMRWALRLEGQGCPAD